MWKHFWKLVTFWSNETIFTKLWEHLPNNVRKIRKICKILSKLWERLPKNVREFFKTGKILIKRRENFGKLKKFWTNDEENLSKLGEYLLEKCRKILEIGNILIKWENFEQIMGSYQIMWKKFRR